MGVPSTTEGSYPSASNDKALRNERETGTWITSVKDYNILSYLRDKAKSSREALDRINKGMSRGEYKD
jgi:hypothetical protein